MRPLPPTPPRPRAPVPAAAPLALPRDLARPRPLAVALALALPACAPPPPAAAPVVDVPVAAPAASASASAAPAPPAPAPIPSAHVDAVGCALAGTTTDRLAIAHGPGRDAVFAAVATREPVRVVIAEGGAPSSVALRVFGLDLDAALPDNGVRLHARAPLALAGVYDPAARVPLHWSATPRLRVEVQGATYARAMVPIAREVACADIGLGVVEFAERALPKPLWTAAATRATPLLPAPGQSPAAELPKGAVVRVHAVTAALAEVSFDDAGLWHGFVPAADLVRAKEVGQGYGVGRGSGRDHALPGFTCPEAMPLYVRRAPEKEPIARVGVVRAGAHVALSPVGDARFRPLAGDQRARAHEPGEIALRAGFELVVDAAATRACTFHAAPDPGANP